MPLPLSSHFLLLSACRAPDPVPGATANASRLRQTRGWPAQLARAAPATSTRRSTPDGMCYSRCMNLTLETEQEDDGRWVAEVPQLSGVLAYGATREEAMSKAEVLALRVLAEQLEHGEARPVGLSISVAAE